MPRRFLLRYLPRPGSIKASSQLRLLGRLIEDPMLLHLNRRSVAGGVAVGLFVAFIPLPIQMILAALLAILLRVNLVIAVVAVWISNPFTMPPMFYFSYVVGTWIIGGPVISTAFEPTLSWFWQRLSEIWQPLLMGSFVVGSIVSLAGYGAVHLLWRLHVIHVLRRRRARRSRPS
jgi:uncharacterized protein (DUF2062 family)